MRSSTLTNTPNAMIKTAAPISGDSLVTRSCSFSPGTNFADAVTRICRTGRGGASEPVPNFGNQPGESADRDTVAVPKCCDHDDYQSVFSGRFARRTSKRYQRRGLTPAARAIADYVESCGISGATVLEIGGGVGHLQVELLRRGASHVTNLEIS